MTFDSSIYRSQNHPLVQLCELKQHDRSPVTMCLHFRNFYIYAMCNDPGAHFVKMTEDISMRGHCAQAPHERFIIIEGSCPVCG